MATVTKDFRVKSGLVVEGSTATVNGHDILTEALVDAKGDILVASAADAVAPSKTMLVSKVPTAAGADHLTPFVSDESAVRTYPFVPTVTLVPVFDPVPTSKSPFASNISFVTISCVLTVAVDPSTTSPDFTLKSFVTVAIFYLLG